MGIRSGIAGRHNEGSSERGGGGTYKTHKDLVFGLDGHLPAVVLDDSVWKHSFAVGTERTGQADALHGVTEEQGIRLLGRRLGGNQVDLRERLGPLGRQVKVYSLGKLCGSCQHTIVFTENLLVLKVRVALTTSAWFGTMAAAVGRTWLQAMS